MIEIKNITHFFKGKNTPVISDVSLRIENKERVVLTGISGVGKSTLANIIAGHIKPAKGKIIIDEEDVTNKPSKKIILINQESDLFPWLTVYKQVESVLKNDKDSEYRRQKIHHVLKMVKLVGNEQKYPHELSGGMKKRVSLARALAVNPKLLILDETFSSLDHCLKSQLIDDLVRMLDETGSSVLLITHDRNDTAILGGKQITLYSEKLVYG